MDRRQQKTRTAIFDAFGQLLSAKSYSKITVQEIIDTANVGRTTFYAHFETKDTLLRDMCIELFDHIFSDDLSAEITHDFSATKGNPNEMITHILYHLLENKRNILGILVCESGELFLQFFREYLDKLIINHFLKNAKHDGTIPTDFLVNHISSSFVGMVQWWIKSNLHSTPEELAIYFSAVIVPVIERH